MPNALLLLKGLWRALRHRAQHRVLDPLDRASAADPWKVTVADVIELNAARRERARLFRAAVANAEASLQALRAPKP